MKTGETHRLFYKTGKTRGAIRLNQNRNGRILIGSDSLINDNTSNLTAFNTHKSTIKIPNLNQIIESNLIEYVSS